MNFLERFKFKISKIGKDGSILKNQFGSMPVVKILHEVRKSSADDAKNRVILKSRYYNVQKHEVNKSLNLSREVPKSILRQERGKLLPPIQKHRQLNQSHSHCRNIKTRRNLKLYENSLKLKDNPSEGIYKRAMKEITNIKALKENVKMYPKNLHVILRENKENI